MSADKKFDRTAVIITVIALLITVMFMNGERLGIEKIVDEDAEKYSDLAWFTSKDQNGEWDTTNATVITLNGDSASVSGKGAYAVTGSVIISNAGYYIVSGTLTDGYISVDAYQSSKVWILLDGVDISCSDNACIRVEEADKVFLTLAEGSENILTGGAELSDEALRDGTGGVIFARDDLTINGSGSLTINAGYKHGIDANDDMILTGGSITITALQDGIHANDSIRIMNAELAIDAGDDGLMVSKEGGYLVMQSGTVNVTAGGDAIHTAGIVTIDGGDLTISAEDDGIHSDAGITINGGTVLISKCYEGIEAVTIDINGGDITIYPSDDGLNANGGSGGFMMGGFGRGRQQAESTAAPAETPSEQEETYVRISGGSLTIINENARDADGIDSNGNLYITGGTIRVSLPGGGSNNAIDFGSESGGKALISGGSLAAAGGATMAENFDESSEQPVIMYNLTGTVEGGTEVLVLDADGNELIRYAPPQSFNSVFLSSPEMKVSETYTVVIGDTEEEVTLETDAVTIGSAGMGAMGGGFNRGGGRGRNREMTEMTGTSTAEPSEEGSGRPDGMTPPEGGMPEFAGTGMPGQFGPMFGTGEMPEWDGTMQPQGGRGGPGGMMPPDGEAPAFDGTMTPPAGMPDRGQGMGGPMGPGAEQQRETEEAEETVPVSTAKALSEFGNAVWIPLGASVLALLAALLYAVKYKR